MSVLKFIFFFFQAEDGIRDLYVTGVQTCALPILSLTRVSDKASQFGICMADPDPAEAPHSLFYDAGKPLNRCLTREKTPLSYLSSIEGELYYRTGTRANFLARYDLDALAVDAHEEDLCASFTDGLFHALAGVWFNQKDHAAASARSAYFSGQCAIAAGVFDHAVDGLRRNSGQISHAEGPLLAHQAAGFIPIGFFQRHAHFLGNFRDALQTFLDGALPSDLRFENFPIVDPVLARLAGVADHHAALELVQVHTQFDAMLAAGREFDGGSAAEGWRVMVLRARRHIDYDGLGVAADMDPIDFALPCSRETIKRSANGYGHGTGAADACS